ncbi:MAG: hypothetical protein JXB00_07065 [Bacteroidales bacterium]|nr:hypothetical protein [Bacteroidales bacterium]
MKRFCILFLVFSILSPLYSQERLIRFTYSIADTTKSKTDQARKLYSWITNNIAYDTRQLIKGGKKYTPLETINRKKAICYGYAELYHSMCDILDIESYLIYGYCKGFAYVKGNHFTKADHSWNIIHADTNWIIIDATWGSGTLKYDYDFKTRLLQTFSKKKGIKTKIEFVREPCNGYFNLPPSVAIKTHFPLDAKWQLLDYPVPYHSFINDSAVQPRFLNYLHEISFVRLRDVHDQVFIDARNSTKYSPFNKFDIANQYFNQANKYEVTKKSKPDSLLLENIERSICYADSSLKYLNEFKLIRRSDYKSKKLERKAAAKLGITSIKRMQKIPTSINNKFERIYRNYLKKEVILEKGRSASAFSKHRLPQAFFWAYDSVTIKDSILISELTLKNIDDIQEISVNINTIISLKDSIYAKLLSGSNHNDSIIEQADNMVLCLQKLQLAIDTMDEFEVLHLCTKLSSILENYDKQFKNKQKHESELINDFNDFQRIAQKTVRSMVSVLDNFRRLAKLTGYNLEYATKADSLLPVIQQFYSVDLQVYMYLLLYNESWKDLLNTQNSKLEAIGPDGLPDMKRRLMLYFNFITENADKSFMNDMQTYESIKSSAQKKLRNLKEYSRMTKRVLNSIVIR